MTDLLQTTEGNRSRYGFARKDGLTVREIEVLKLVASGNTDQQIAEILVVSRRTVNNHVRNIFNKVEVSNRAEAAVYAARQGLV